MATIAELQQRRQQLIDQIATAEALIQSNRRRVIDFEGRLPITQPNSSQRKRLEDGIKAAQDEIARQTDTVTRLTFELDSVINQIATAQQAPTQSTGATVTRDSEGRQEAANSQTPPAEQARIGADGRIQRVPTPSTDGATTNATRASTDATTGTNAALRPAKGLQSTPATVANAPLLPSPSGPQPGQVPGTAAGGDDAATTATQQRINAIFGGNLGRIVTQPNVLDDYVSYTYNASIYIMSPGQYQRLMSSKQKNLSGFQLLMRSGGAPQAGASTAAPDIGDEVAAAEASAILQAQGRSQFFPLDFYLDDITLRSVIQGKGTGGAHNVVELNFKIYEPNGISLIPNLQKAAAFMANLAGKSGNQNYAAQLYLMVIRFYGQTTDGTMTPVQGVLRDENGQPTGKPEVIEKFIPFLFTGIKFRVIQKVTEYECTAACPQNFVNTSRGRGVIPYNVEITSRTLQELFAGNLGYTTTQQTSNTDGRQLQEGVTASGLPREARGVRGSAVDQVAAITRSAANNTTVAGQSPTQNTAPPKADAAATPTINQGLFEALKKYQEDLRVKGTITYADEYSIEIDPVLAQARVVPPGEINKIYTAMNTGQTARDKKDPATNRMDTTTKNTSAMAGMSIVQFIDQYTRTSTYVYDQQIVTFDPRTNQPKVRPYIPGQVVAWYHIGLQAEPKLDQWDPKRNDYAYRIKFSLTPYQVNDLKSDYFPQGRYQGAHKVYDFWFTGQNSQVINFEQDFNYLYYLVINNPRPTQTTGQTTSVDEYQDEIRRFYQPRSDQSSQGQDREVNEPSANAADYLYSPADQARVKMTIVGDPAWIQQGELWQGVAGVGYGEAFQNDGTISYDNREILFEIAFNMPVDYDLDNGLMDAGARNTAANRAQNQPGRARQRYVYRAIEVTSTFSKGAFTQDLQGVLIQFDLPRQQQITNNSVNGETNERPRDPSVFLTGPDQSDAETRRLNASQNQARFGGTTFADRANRAGVTLANARREQGRQIFGAQNDNPLATSTIEAEGFGAALGTAEVNPPTSSGLPVGAESLGTTAVTRTPGSAPPIAPVTQLTADQQELVRLNRQLDQAIGRGNTAQVAQINRDIARIEARELRNNPPAPTTRTNQTVKER